jgi:plasmid stabilization system protein ParE
MKYALRIRPNAEEDLRQAYAWYEEQRVGLGDDFLLCYEAALDAIIENPTRFPIIQHKIRRTLIRRFPYAIYYVFDPKTI